MSAFASQREFHRMLSEEEEIHVRQAYATGVPQSLSESNYLLYLQHIGAHLSQGSAKGSLPAYPERVEVSEDEAVLQPGGPIAGDLRALEPQHSPAGGRRRGERPQLIRDLRRDQFCLSLEEFELFKSQCLDAPQYDYQYERSEQSRTSTPNQTNDAPNPGYTSHPAAPTAFSESHTPSHCSAVTSEDEMCKEGVGPSPPYPFSKWDPFRSKYRPENMRTGFEQTVLGAQDTRGSTGESELALDLEISGAYCLSL